jgi:hypothetical protein
MRLRSLDPPIGNDCSRSALSAALRRFCVLPLECPRPEAPGMIKLSEDVKKVDSLSYNDEHLTNIYGTELAACLKTVSMLGGPSLVSCGSCT